MKKIGLALSGGGFRASLYHLGLVRFLRDAGILPQVTHITSVSGGSIIAAHLALHWGRYTGSANEFDAAASELLAFIRLDVRNRILRRFPLCIPLRWPRRFLGLSNRRLVRAGLLEYHYEKFLFGDRSLFELPERPQLHILATNLSEGCLCSFNRDGLWMMRLQPGRPVQVGRVHVGLATVPMAVAASSAFPGFFPPLELTGRDVGARGGEFGRQAYTDGGVFDNLGVRMFRYLEPLLVKQERLDGVLVSDTGKRIEVQSLQRAGGLIRTAMRASDILMDRVWQLENDIFEDTPGFVFARITNVVKPSEDLSALHPEIQRQIADIRTDLDRFSPLEISSLVRHGYCVGRMACKSRPDLFGADLPANAPWDPIPSARDSGAPVGATRLNGPNREAGATTVEARTLQASAVRRIWRTLLDYRDWTSYIYVPIIIPILFFLPYVVFRSYEHSRAVSRLVESIAQGSRDYDLMARLIDGPIPTWPGEVAEEVRKFDELDFKGFTVLQDSRILDLRPWNPNIGGKGDTTSLVYGYRRLKVAKNSEHSGNNILRMGLLATHPKTQVRFPVQQLPPKLYQMCTDSAVPGEKTCRFEMNVDFQKVPVGDAVDLIYEHYSPGVFLQRGDSSTTMSFRSEADTAEVTRWFLMPRGRDYRSFRIVRYETGKPETAEPVKGFSEYLAEDSTILAFKLMSVKGGYTFEVTWFYR
jgi:predicted acylesterase/phospholipase RssA